jgi:hypothetical protein
MNQLEMGSRNDELGDERDVDLSVMGDRREKMLVTGMRFELRTLDLFLSPFPIIRFQPYDWSC